MDLWAVCGALRTPNIIIVNMKSIYIYTRLGLASFVSLNCLMSDNFILNFPVTKPSITGIRLCPTFMVFGAAKFIVVDGHIVWNHIFSEDVILVLFFIVGVFCQNNGFDAIFLQTQLRADILAELDGKAHQRVQLVWWMIECKFRQCGMFDVDPVFAVIQKTG